MTTEAPSIRPASESDREAIYRLARDFATSFEVQHREFDRVFDQTTQDDSMWLGVADSNGNVIAYLLGLDHLKVRGARRRNID